MGTESMEQEVRPKPELNHLVPSFELRSVEGETISPWDYKERKNLVLLFFDPRSTRDLGLLAEMKRRYHEIADENAEVLAIGSGPYEEMKECIASLGMPFKLLSDSDNQARQAYGISDTSVFITDRFGELRMYSSVPDDIDKLMDAMVSVLDLVELECPECGVSAWPEGQPEA